MIIICEGERGRPFPGRPAISVLWGWLVPGLGHIREGKKSIGLLVGRSILLIYAMGLWFSEFRGVDRRMQLRGRALGAMVMDDYGHHPTEIAATLGAIREGFGARTLVVFQPHRFTRTRALLEEFGGAFFLADKVIVTEIYPAGEQPIDGLDGSVVADALVRHGHPSVSAQQFIGHNNRIQPDQSELDR